MEQTVKVVSMKPIEPSKGSAGLSSQVYGETVTVSAVSQATGGIGKGNVITTSNK